MKFISARQAAAKWGVDVRRVQDYCAQGRVKGAERVGNMWFIPEGAGKPGRKRRDQPLDYVMGGKRNRTGRRHG